MVDFSIKADFSQVDKMLKRYGDRAVSEYRKALDNTSRYGLQEIKNANPVRTGASKNSWKWSFKGELVTGITNEINYIRGLNFGWSRTSPINTRAGRTSSNPKAKPALVFLVGKRTAAKSDPTTLYARYKKAMKGLKGKGLDQATKSRLATQKSGVVVVRSVKTPARYKGKRFIEPTVDKISKYLNNAIIRANERLLA